MISENRGQFSADLLKWKLTQIWRIVKLFGFLESGSTSLFRMTTCQTNPPFFLFLKTSYCFFLLSFFFSSQKVSFIFNLSLYPTSISHLPFSFFLISLSYLSLSPSLYVSLFHYYSLSLELLFSLYIHLSLDSYLIFI